jgi:hypothetical protein
MDQGLVDFDEFADIAQVQIFSDVEIPGMIYRVRYAIRLKASYTVFLQSSHKC